MAKRRSRWRAVAARVLACALIGVAANIALCWTCAFLETKFWPVKGTHGGYRIDSANRTYWVEHQSAIARKANLLRLIPEAPTKDWENAPASPTPVWIPAFGRIARMLHNPSGSESGSLYVNGYGWPLCSMYEARRFERTGLISAGSFEVQFGHRSCFVPLRILPVPFVLCILLWGGLIGSTSVIATRLRRRARIRRVHCPVCAYSLRGLAPFTTICPECGTPIPPTTSSV